MINIVNLSDIKPASYNPRVIGEKQFEMLQRSIRELGIIMPVLVNSQNNTLIAGHQRTKAMQAVGIEQAPAIFIDNINIGDEIKFNQLHNAIEKEPVKLSRCNVSGEGFQVINNKSFHVSESNAVYVREICNLLSKYGNALSCIVSDGKVLMGNNYVKACKLLNIDVLTYHLPADKLDLFNHYFSADYGEYNYEGIERKTFVQGLAQLHRKLDRTDGKREYRSKLYEGYALPFLVDKDKGTTILDFGCGKATYITLLSKRYKALGLEFFNNNGHKINMDKGHLMIDRLISQLKKDPAFDVVVCDSVLNSVDSQEAEKSVIDCLNLFCKIGGKLFISGRTYDAMVNKLRMSKDTTTGKRFLEFVDSNGLTANYRKGQWYFQKFHKKDQIEETITASGFKIETIAWNKGDGFYIVATKENDLPIERYIEAVNFEFNLPLPNGKTYNRHTDILEVLGLDDHTRIDN